MFNSQEMMEKILRCLNEGHLLTGSDGSVKDDRGACAFCVGDLQSPNCMKGTYLCPGYHDEMSSLRAELYGAIGIALCIKLIADKYQNKVKETAKYWAYIDNDTVIERMNKGKRITPKDVLVPEYNLTEEIRAITKTTKCKAQWQWIKGHDEDDITPAGMMNKQMDKDANTCRQTYEIVNRMLPFPNKQP